MWQQNVVDSFGVDLGRVVFATPRLFGVVNNQSAGTEM